MTGVGADMQTLRSPGPSVFDNDGWWDPDGSLHGLHALLGPVRGPYILSTLRAAGIAPGSRVLDLGSGGGFISSTLSDVGYEVAGIDPAESSVREAAEHVAADFMLVYGENLPFSDGSFDAVVCSEVLEHVEDPNAVIAEAARVLRPGGTLVFSLPNPTLLSMIVLIWLAQRNVLTRVLPQDLHEWNRFIGPADLRRRLLRNDLMVTEVHGVSITPSSIPATIAAMLRLRLGRISYADAGSRVQLQLSRSRAVAYIGYAVKLSK